MIRLSFVFSHFCNNHIFFKLHWKVGVKPKIYTLYINILLESYAVYIVVICFDMGGVNLIYRQVQYAESESHLCPC